MNETELRRFAPLYQAAHRYGGDRILLNWLGEHDRTLPLMVPHGVEFPGQFHEPSDVRRIEPIYWAANRKLHRQAQQVKPSVLIPHPLLLCPSFEKSEQTKRSGTLIIGAPPGISNDRNMLECLQLQGITAGTILIKHRVGWQKSGRFWRENGYETTTFGDQYSVTYDNMARTFSSYEEVVSTTVSSAVFFAAACGARATLIRGCSLQAYELMTITDLYQLENPEGRNWLKHFVESDIDRQRELALDLLGNDLRDKKRVRSELDAAIISLRRPLYLHDSVSPKFPTNFLASMAVKLNRPGLASLRPSALLKAFSASKIGILTVKNVDFFLDGISADAFTLEPVAYRRGVTEPGNAVDPY